MHDRNFFDGSGKLAHRIRELEHRTNNEWRSNMTTNTKLERRFSLRNERKQAPHINAAITSQFIAANGGELTAQNIKALNILLMLSAKKYDLKTEANLKAKLSALLGFDV